jgi:hypothetical protein
MHRAGVFLRAGAVSMVRRWRVRGLRREEFLRIALEFFAAALAAK